MLQIVSQARRARVQVSGACQLFLWFDVDGVEGAPAVGSASGSMGEGTSAETFWSISASSASSDSVVGEDADATVEVAGGSGRWRGRRSGNKARRETTAGTLQYISCERAPRAD